MLRSLDRSLLVTLALYSPVWLPARRGGSRAEADKLSVWLSPNAWELIVIFAYFQHLGSISMMDLTKTPHFVLDFTDSFSWTNLNVYAMGVEVTRRLDYTILTGMVAYADRLGIQEAKLLAYTTRCFFVTVGIILTCFFLTILWQCCFAKSRPTTSNSTNRFALSVLGLATAVWKLSVHPLSATSSYEMRMQVKYSITGDLSIILFNIVFVVLGGLVLLIRRVQRIRPEEAMDARYVAVFGTLYADVKQIARYFFALFTLFQMALGMSVGVIDQGPNQLIAQLIIHSVFIVALIVVRPYHQPVVNIFVGALTVLRMVNLVLATAFVTVSSMPTQTRGSHANIFVFTNFIVVLSIFFRQCLVVLYVVRVWSQKQAAGDMAHSSDEHDGRLTYSIPPSTNTGSSDDEGFPPRDEPAAWASASALSISDVESPVPNLANRPMRSPFRYEYVVAKK